MKKKQKKNKGSSETKAPLATTSSETPIASEVKKAVKVAVKTPKKKAEKKKKKEKKGSSQKNEIIGLSTVSKFLGSIKAKHLDAVLEDLMTTKEIKEFAERIEILKLLKKKISQRVIAKKLTVSVTTVSRGSKVLQDGKQKIKKYL